MEFFYPARPCNRSIFCFFNSMQILITPTDFMQSMAFMCDAVAFQTSIYEVLSNKAAAMSEQRKALMTTLTESSSSKKTDDKLNTTFTK